MVCRTLDCVSLMQSSMIRTIHRNVGQKCFYLPKCFLLSVVYSYVYILQGSVETHLRCGGMYTVSQEKQPKRFRL